MDELQTLIKLVLLHNTCCHAKLDAHRDKGKWIKESSSHSLPSRKHDSGSGSKRSGERSWRGPARSSSGTLGLSHTHLGEAVGTGRLCRATTIDHQHHCRGEAR